MDPKEDLKKLIKKAKNELDPEGAEREEKKESSDKISSISKGTERMTQFLDVLKGDDGYTPVKGVDYWTEEELAQIKEEIRPILGKDYLTGDDVHELLEAVTPRKGEHYFTQEEIEEFIQKVTPIKGIHYRDVS